MTAKLHNIKTLVIYISNNGQFAYIFEIEYTHTHKIPKNVTANIIRGKNKGKQQPPTKYSKKERSR